MQYFQAENRIEISRSALALFAAARVSESHQAAKFLLHAIPPYDTIIFPARIHRTTHARH
jgi:hypothetical protein